MGADAFVAFYGVRHTLADDEVDGVETGIDERLKAAGRVKLQTYFSRLTDGEPYFLLIGSRLGVFGIENEAERSMTEAELTRVMRDTAAKLREVGLSGEPRLHLQLVSQY